MKFSPGAGITVTALMDDRPSQNGALTSEHGLSYLVEGEGFRFLFDCGASGRTWDNAERLGLDLRDVDGVILSHSHYDHAGGYPALLEIGGGGGVLYTGPGFFEKKFSRDGQHLRDLSAGFGPELLRRNGVNHRVVEGLIRLFPGVYLIGNFPRVHSFETIPARFLRETRVGIAADDFGDEICLAVDTPEGLAVFVGCSHPGILNMTKRVSGLLGRPIRAVFGGTHLAEADPKRTRETVAALRDMGLEILGLSHCSGEAAETAAEALGLRGCHLAPGDRIRL